MDSENLDYPLQPDEHNLDRPVCRESENSGLCPIGPVCNIERRVLLALLVLCVRLCLT